LVDVGAGDEHGGAALPELVGRAVAPKLLDDAGGVGGVEAAEEEGVVRPAGPVGHAAEEGHAAHDDGAEGEPLADREAAEEGAELGEIGGHGAWACGVGRAEWGVRRGELGTWGSEPGIRHYAFGTTHSALRIRHSESARPASASAPGRPPGSCCGP